MPSDELSGRPGRLKAAWLALLGHPVVPDQIRAEWTAWQLELEAVCDKISAAAARLTTRHKRELDRALEELNDLRAEREADPVSFGNPSGAYNPAKAALWRRVRAQRNGEVASVLRDQGEQGSGGA